MPLALAARTARLSPGLGFRCLTPVLIVLTSTCGIGTASSNSAHRAENTITYVAIDVETTGLSANNNRIVEVAAVQFSRHGIVASTNWLVNPGRPIPSSATRIHGITDNTVKDAPDFASIVPNLTAFTGSRPVIAHNAPFDQRFLNAAFIRCGQPAVLSLADSLPIIRRARPDLKRYTLASVALACGIEQEPNHRARQDAEVLALVLIKLLASERGPTIAGELQKMHTVTPDSKGL